MNTDIPIGTRDEEIARFLAAVEDALTDLPSHVRGELVADLVDHLAEIADEQPVVPLSARLGAPEEYAAELRATVSGPSTQRVVTPGPSSPPPATDWRSLLARANLSVGSLLSYPKATDFLRAIRPSWWVLRGFALAQIMIVLLLGEYRYYWYMHDYRIITLIALLGFYLGAVVVSIRVARGPSTVARWTNIFVNVLGVAAIWTIAIDRSLWMLG